MQAVTAEINSILVLHLHGIVCFCYFILQIWLMQSPTNAHHAYMCVVVNVYLVYCACMMYRHDVANASVPMDLKPNTKIRGYQVSSTVSTVLNSFLTHALQCLHKQVLLTDTAAQCPCFSRRVECSWYVSETHMQQAIEASVLCTTCAKRTKAITHYAAQTY